VGERDDLEDELTVPAVGPASVVAAVPSGPPPRGAAPAAFAPAGLPPGASASSGPAAPAAAPSPAHLPAPASARWQPTHLWLAVRGALQLRRTIEVTLGLLVIGGLVLFFRWLGAQSSHAAIPVLGNVLALLTGWVGVALLSGGLTAALHQELLTGRRVGLGAGMRWATAHFASVTLTPLALLGLGLALVLLVALLQLTGKLPAIGRALYGLSFGLSLLVSLGTVFLLLFALLAGFYYLPLLQPADRGPLATLGLLTDLFRRRGGRAVWLLALTSGLGFLFASLLGAAAIGSLGITAAMGLGLLGPPFLQLVGRIPAPLVDLVAPVLELLHVGLPVRSVAGPSLEAGALLMGLGLLLWLAFLAALLLVYWCGGGLVSYFVLTGREREES